MFVLLLKKGIGGREEIEGRQGSLCSFALWEIHQSVIRTHKKRMDDLSSLLVLSSATNFENSLLVI